MPSWVKSEPVWDKAKKAATKSDAEDYWALVTHIYKSMGGKIKSKTESKDQTGVKQPAWFWGADNFPSGKTALGSAPKAKDKPMTGEGLPDANELAQKLLLEHPEMNAATLLNALKSKGIDLVMKPLEADSGVGQPVGVLGDSKESGKTFKSTNWHFTEGTGAKDNGIGYTRYRVALIQEGLGNLGDAYYYTRKALESAVAIFEGKKCFADHPSASEDQDRPERSVRDVVGHFENVRLEEGDQGQAMLVGDLIMLPDKPYEWARALVRHAVDYSEKYPDKEFIGLSINASGDAEAVAIEDFIKEAAIPEGAKPKLQTALAEGVTQVKVVNAITDAVSCDIVTEPGARGKVIEMLEGEKKMEGEEKKQADAPAAHDDEQQDKDLIMDMLKKHGLIGEKKEGEETEESDESEECGDMKKHAMEAVEAYKEMGYSEEEAMEAAGHAMKLAKHMAAKKKEAEESGEESMPKGKEEKPEDEEKHEAEESEEAKKKESEILKLRGEVARLKEAQKKIDLDKHIDKKLAESKLPMSVTKKIKESIGEVKSEKDFDKAYSLFMEGYKAVGNGGEAITLAFVETEKTVEQKDGAFSFANCITE